MEIGNFQADELGSFRKEYNCSLCGQLIKLDEPHTWVKPIGRFPGLQLHLHRNCTIQLQILLDAHVALERLPLRIAMGALRPDPDDQRLPNDGKHTPPTIIGCPECHSRGTYQITNLDTRECREEKCDVCQGTRSLAVYPNWREKKNENTTSSG